MLDLEEQITDVDDDNDGNHVNHSTQGENTNFYQKRKKRSAVVTQEYPERNVGFVGDPTRGLYSGSYYDASTKTAKPLIPGASSYDEAVRDGKRVMVFSTSITKGIKVREFNKSVNGGTARFRRFHGGKVDFIIDYADTHMDKEKPEVVIIQAGGNDLPTPKDSPVPVENIAKTLVDIGIKCKRYGVKKVLIGSVITRKKYYMDKRKEELNEYLESMCHDHGFYYINNDNILRKHLVNDGVHLNEEGDFLLATNYLDSLNSVL